MPDIEQLVNNVKELFQLFGAKVPSWLWSVITFAIVLVLLSKFISSSLSFLNTVKNEWSQLLNPEKIQHRKNRQFFAAHIERIIWHLSLNEDWKDKRFAELEAEVEAEDRYRVFSLLPFPQTKSGLRRVRSLSKALESSRDRLVLLEGEPGSGKSVALRHVVDAMAKKAKSSPDLKSVIPIYVNLKELEQVNGVTVDRNLIEQFVLESLKRSNDRDIDQFLDDEFQQGVRNGTWFFIFDSFDELPDILSATEANQVVRSYGDAIDAFLHGMNSCRSIVASRQFRGPAYLGWPKFRILPLSEKYRRRLIQRSALAPKLARELVGQLGNANSDILTMAGNPLFLALLCEYMKSGKPFPLNTHAVFETYIENRLERDEVRLTQRFGLSPTQIRTAAENVAFCMTADIGIGLSPTRGNLQEALTRQQMTVPDNFHTLLDALEFIKLARSDETASTGLVRPFTFAHRRIQEYFATCVVLRETARLAPEELLTNARWRETAVVLCQTQPANELAPLLEQAERLLTQFGSSIPDLIDDPLDYVHKQDAIRKQVTSSQKIETMRDSFSWPTGLPHLLSILQEGFISRLIDLPNSVRTLIDSLVLSATEERPLYDRKWALEVAGAASEPILAYLLNQAFSQSSEWFKETAYRQTIFLSTLPSTITRTICRAIIGLSLSGRLRQERYTTKAHLARLPKSPVNFISIMQLLLFLPLIDFALIGIMSICTLPALTILILLPSATPNFLKAVFIFYLLFMYCVPYLFVWTSNMHYLSYRGLYQVTIPIIFRLLFVFFCIGLLGSVRSPGMVIYMLIAAQALLLVPFALVAAEIGHIKSWLPWIFVPFWSIFWFISYLHIWLPLFITPLLHKERNAQSVRDFLFFTLKLILFLVILAIFGVIIYLASLYYGVISVSFIKIYNRMIIIHIFTNILVFIFFASILTLELLIGYKKVRTVYEDIWQFFLETPHRRLWKAFIKNAQGEMTCQEWWATMEKYNTYTFASGAKVIRSVREKRLLIATEETENFIKLLAAQAEAKLQNMTYAGLLNISIDSLDIYIDSYQKFLQNVDNYVLDEIHRLLEDMHSRMKGKIYD